MDKSKVNKVLIRATCNVPCYSMKGIVEDGKSRTIYRLGVSTDGKGGELDCYFGVTADGYSKFFDKNLKEIKFYDSHKRRVHVEKVLDPLMMVNGIHPATTTWEKERLGGRKEAL